MALVLALRNAGKLNASGILKTARLNSLSTYTTLVAAQRTVISKPLTLVKNVAPLTRNISLTAPKLSSNHTVIWNAERAISMGLLPIVPLALLFPSQALDALLAVSVVLHSHWGVEAMVTDYLRPAVVGNVLPKVAHVGLILLSIATLGGLFYFIYNDIGIAKAVRELWSVKGYTAPEEEPAPIVKPGGKPGPGGKSAPGAKPPKA